MEKQSKKKRRFEHKWQPAWQKEFPFIEYDTQKKRMSCSHCIAYVAMSKSKHPLSTEETNAFVVGTPRLQHSGIKKHVESDLHLRSTTWIVEEDVCVYIPFAFDQCFISDVLRRERRTNISDVLPIREIHMGTGVRCRWRTLQSRTGWL
jgi:hypothetical protein